MRRILDSVIVLLLLTAVVGAFVFYPFYTLKSLAIAARNGDIVEIDSLIDWPQLRASVKTEVRALMAASKPAGTEEPFAALGLIISGVAADAMVESMLNPKWFATIAAKAPADHDISTMVSHARFTSISTFVADIRSPEQTESAVSLVLELQSLRWRVTRVVVRHDAFNRAMQPIMDQLPKAPDDPLVGLFKKTTPPEK